MPEVIKPNRVVRLDNVVYITDDAPDLSEAEEENGDLRGGAEDGGGEEADGALAEAEKLRGEEEDMRRRMMDMARAEREKILDQARSEAFKIREQARQDAYSQVIGRVDDALAEMGALLDEMQERQQAYFLEYRNELRFLALDISEKILGSELEESDSAMDALVRQAVSAVKGADWMTVEISDRLVSLANRLTEEFSLQYPSRQIEVLGGKLPPGGCVVHTDGGVIDASVSRQLENLRGVFDDLGAAPQ